MAAAAAVAELQRLERERVEEEILAEQERLVAEEETQHLLALERERATLEDARLLVKVDAKEEVC